ncbi:MAG: 2-C-methyl-D-erythritol 2,4-cyclodiphosphate synthase [Thermodesulfobacteriota bacterium]
MKVGFGYDVHRLEEGRKLILGGVTVPYEKGLAGHSDADVLLHAVIDALLGAAGAGDIGKHFPPSDASFKDISSIVLLEKSVAIIKELGFSIINIDSTIVCERPKLAEYIPGMVEMIAAATGLEPGSVNVKATTTEGLGFTGRGEGVAAFGAVLVKKEEG